MSKALSRVRALVSEINQIQTQGRKASSSVPLMTAVQAERVEKPLKIEQVAKIEQAAKIEQIAPVREALPLPPVEVEPNNVLPINSQVTELPVKEAVPEGKVFIQLTGKIAVQLQLEDSEEIVEVRQLEESIEIRFTDGKAIHLPLRNVA